MGFFFASFDYKKLCTLVFVFFLNIFVAVWYVASNGENKTFPIAIQRAKVNFKGNPKKKEFDKEEASSIDFE